jgi:hypothetical protein
MKAFLKQNKNVWGLLILSEAKLIPSLLSVDNLYHLDNYSEFTARDWP